MNEQLRSNDRHAAPHPDEPHIDSSTCFESQHFRYHKTLHLLAIHTPPFHRGDLGSRENESLTVGKRFRRRKRNTPKRKYLLVDYRAGVVCGDACHGFLLYR